MALYQCGLSTDIGVEREKQEDYAAYQEFDDHMLCVVADGTGSKDNYLQPAVMITTDIVNQFTTFYENQKEALLNDPLFYLRYVMDHANSMIGDFKVANEELYSGYAASVTALLLLDDKRIFVAHSGNTRLYLIRDGKLNQLTRDHTRAMELLDEGVLDIESYYLHPARLEVTSGIGVVPSPEIQTLKGKIKENDVLLLTSDGIHYAIRPEAIAEIVLAAGNPLASTQALIEAAKNEVKYPDNMAAVIVA